ncbi:MAG: TIGR03560 family F420-dependent LLM class oxidoreductase [Actinomycetia bacterium]|nr:TIGR03560 family F420-dependent LLM class oxidoreductase [Actinomycetes bacterium]
MVEYALKTPPQHGAWSDYLDVWRAADECETFTTAWNFDHFYPLIGDTDGPCLESWTMLAALAQATSRIRIGSMVNGMHYRHPAVTANMAATVDHVSDGRLELGMGAGWNLEESDAYGIKLGTITERLDRFEEGIEVIVGLLSQEVTNFAGSYYTITDARCEPKPIQRPHPPLVIGGSGKKRTLAVVARWAQQWDASFSNPEGWKESNDALLGHCERIGRDQNEIKRSVHLAWPAGADPAQLADEAQVWVGVVDQIIFSMRGPFVAAEVEPLGAALTQRGSQ